MAAEHYWSYTHKCPGPQCRHQIPYMQLACRGHWHQVPQAIRDAVYRAWQGGKGAGTTAHAAAMAAAIRSMTPLAG